MAESPGNFTPSQWRGYNAYVDMALRMGVPKQDWPSIGEYWANFTTYKDQMNMWKAQEGPPSTEPRRDWPRPDLLSPGAKAYYDRQQQPGRGKPEWVTGYQSDLRDWMGQSPYERQATAPPQPTIPEGWGSGTPWGGTGGWPGIPGIPSPPAPPPVTTPTSQKPPPRKKPKNIWQGW